MQSKFKGSLLSVLFLLTILVSCAGHEKKMTENAAVPTMTDDQIAQIVSTVNAGEIQLANHALATTKNSEVKKFAQHMVTDHTMNNQKVGGLGTKNNMTPAESPKSMALEKESELSMTMLKDLKGAAFDKAYIADQLKTHQNVWEDLNTNLIPAAKNEELKEHLKLTAKKVEAHLEHAKMIHSKL